MADIGLRSQDLVEKFCQDPNHLEDIIYVDEIDSFAVYQADKQYFKIQKKRSFEEHVYRWVKPQIKKSLSTAFVEDLVRQMRWMMYRKKENTKSEYLALTDKLYNIRNFSFEDFGKDKVSFFQINVPSSALEIPPPFPLFQAFLDDVLVKKDSLVPDLSLQTVVQEMFGYCLLNTVEAHSVFFLVGDGANGKSVLLEILKALVGKEFTVSMSIEQLTTDKFAAASLVGKRINVCAEEESMFMKPDRLKALVSGDLISAQRKFGDAFSFVPSVVSFFATNEMPTFRNLNEGLLRRIKIIPFYKKIPVEKRNTLLFQQLLTELPGIFAWAVEGAKRLVANKFRFSDSPVMKHMTYRLQENLSSAISFIRDRYTEKTGAFISNENLYEEYQAWCARRGRKQLNYQNFCDDLRKTLRLNSDIRWNPESKTNERGRQLVAREDTPIPETPKPGTGNPAQTDSNLPSTNTP